MAMATVTVGSVAMGSWLLNLFGRFFLRLLRRLLFLLLCLLRRLLFLLGLLLLRRLFLQLPCLLNRFHLQHRGLLDPRCALRELRLALLEKPHTVRQSPRQGGLAQRLNLHFLWFGVPWRLQMVPRALHELRPALPEETFALLQADFRGFLLRFLLRLLGRLLLGIRLSNYGLIRRLLVRRLSERQRRRSFRIVEYVLLHIHGSRPYRGKAHQKEQRDPHRADLGIPC